MESTVTRVALQANVVPAANVCFVGVGNDVSPAQALFPARNPTTDVSTSTVFPVTEMPAPASTLAAHDPSPRQKVVPEALVPLLRFATGKLPITPVVSGNPVALVNTAADGVPSAGVTSVGLVPNTNAPDPVSFVIAVARFALDGVARAVATPVPRPLMPVATGNPVAFVSVAADGVPRFGVVSVGEVPKTIAPVPVSSVTAVMRFADDGVASAVATPVPNPDTPVVIGSPVALVSTAALGVPRAGVTNMGDVASTIAPVPVSSVIAAARLELLGVASAVATPVPRPEIPVDTGSPVAFVSTPVEGVPMFGVTSVGDVAKTMAPLPVSSVMAAARFELEGVPSAVATPVASPDTPVAIGNPVAFVSVPEAGVPRSGAVITGEVNVLFVRVWVSVVPTTAPEGAVFPANAVRSESSG
jgi:hypothetical protein